MTNFSAKRRKRKLKTPLKNKCILLGISGGVAAYKTVELVRRLQDEGASVSVVMTEAAQRFVTPLALEAVSGRRVHTSLFTDPMAHIKLPSESDLFIVAPATANTIGKFAHGIADDLLSTCFLSYTGPVIIAPSMNWRMYENRVVQKNLSELASAPEFLQVGPERGSLACREEGIGRMADVSALVDSARSALSRKDLTNEKIVVTAGPTREYLDPVRFISNRSSGKMGFALAKAARNRGAAVTLISGPSALQVPCGMRFVRVETAEEMMEAVHREITPETSVLIMAAAVSDFSPSERSGSKIEKDGLTALGLRRTADIISSISSREKKPFIIGFAAETGDNTGRAAEKMQRKRMDMVVFNNVTEPGSGFDVDTNRVVILDARGEIPFDLMDKDSVAEAVLDRLREIRT